MSSPALLLNSAAATVPMNPSAPVAPAGEIGAGTVAAGSPGTDGASDAGAAFLNSFLQVMQQTTKGLPTPLPLPENPLPEFLAEPGIAAPLDGLKADGILEQLLPGDNAGEVLLEESECTPLDALDYSSILWDGAGEGAVPKPETGIPDGDVIPADLPGLPPLAAAEVINPTPPVAAVEYAVPVPASQAAPLADIPLAAPETVETGKRLDLTQWLSRVNSPVDTEIADEPAVSLTAAAAPAAENADALLKNALFARALPATDTQLEFAAGELDAPRLVPDAAVKPAIAPAPAPTDVVNNGRITVPMNLSFGHPQWSEALAERAGWLAHQRIHTADVQLDPPELGPLQVKISVQHDQAVVSFVSANPQVRDLLDQNLTRLRDLLQEQGLQLVDAGVSDQHHESGEDARAAAGDTADAADAGERAPLQPSEGEAPVQATATWGVDDFV